MQKVLILLLIIFLSLFCLAVNVVNLSCATKGVPLEDKEAPISEPAEKLYQSAQGEISNRKYKTALKHLRKSLSLTRNPAQREKIGHLLGESLFLSGYYNDAHKWFQKFLAEFPRTQRLNEIIKRELEIGFKFIRGAKRSLWGLYIIPSYDYGVNIVRNTLRAYPYTEYSDDYYFKMANYLYKQGYYDEAITEYENFLRLYPKSTLASSAEYLLAQSYLALYQGVGYEVTPLLAAQKIVNKFEDKYPQSPINQDIKKMREYLNDLFARRDYEIAMFYKRRNKLESSRIYFEGVIQNHPQTKWAKESSRMLSGERK
ncbi:MAG: outer membrane protein assembly factor BamD [Planctomycetota bacterium]|nr:outer membrane protein assembly factor BamD [Planctomycetota bacterium]